MFFVLSGFWRANPSLLCYVLHQEQPCWVFARIFEKMNNLETKQFLVPARVLTSFHSSEVIIQHLVTEQKVRIRCKEQHGFRRLGFSEDCFQMS